MDEYLLNLEDDEVPPENLWDEIESQMQKKFADMDEEGNFIEDANIQEEDSEDEKHEEKAEGEESESEQSGDDDFHEEEADMNLDNDYMMQ